MVSTVSCVTWAEALFLCKDIDFVSGIPVSLLYCTAVYSGFEFFKMLPSHVLEYP